MDTVQDLLAAKPRRLITTSAAASVRQATRLMNDHGIGSLLVLGGGRLAGIFTERDVLRRVVADGRPPDATSVGEVMTSDVMCCGPGDAVEEVADLMRLRRVRHVPVVDAGGRVVGIVSIGDVNAHRFAACATELVQVRDYILGRA
ncbi:MAG: CBS domain-containing protein [Planctomycetota bacterium]